MDIFVFDRTETSACCTPETLCSRRSQEKPCCIRAKNHFIPSSSTNAPTMKRASRSPWPERRPWPSPLSGCKQRRRRSRALHQRKRSEDDAEQFYAMTFFFIKTTALYKSLLIRTNICIQHRFSSRSQTSCGNRIFRDKGAVCVWHLDQLHLSNNAIQKWP